MSSKQSDPNCDTVLHRAFRARRVRNNGIGGEVRHGVASGVSCETETSLNEQVAPHLPREHRLRSAFFSEFRDVVFEDVVFHNDILYIDVTIIIIIIMMIMVIIYNRVTKLLLSNTTSSNTTSLNSRFVVTSANVIISIII